MNAIGIVVLVLFVAGLALYVVRSYGKMTASGSAKHFGLEPGETARLMWLGEIETEISAASQVATAAAGLVAGALLGGIGIATLRALGVTVLVTTRNRLVLIVEREDGTVGRVFFASPAECTIRHVGPGKKRIQGGASAVFEIAGSDGVPLRVLLHESAVADLGRWVNASA